MLFMNEIMKNISLLLSFLFCFGSISSILKAEESNCAMQNVMGRKCTSLNGEWYALPDPEMVGTENKWWNIKSAINDGELNELNYEGNHILKVPGDWNHQYPEFFYFKGNMWYMRTFYNEAEHDVRKFIHFGAVSQNCDVYLNSKLIGSHTGGYIPFQVEVTDKLKVGENSLVVRVDNVITENTVPCNQSDWFNYGGITRDVNLVSVPETYIKDYSVQLDAHTMKMLNVSIELDGGSSSSQTVKLEIPEAHISKSLVTKDDGKIEVSFEADLSLWSPDNPKLYDIRICSPSDTVSDKIGFRSIKVVGEDILLNGKSVFLKGVNIHEEIPMAKRRACTLADARYLLGEAKALGCNFVRLTHYPQNEYMIRLAESMGIMLWEEIPLWGRHLKLDSPKVRKDAEQMLDEMISRDKNRCNIIIWSVSNETVNQMPGRLETLTALINRARSLDDTRLISSALNSAKLYNEGGRFIMRIDDPLMEHLDVVGNNKYMGWYKPFPCKGEELYWEISPGKPVIFTEFGAEAVFGNKENPTSVNSWSEPYMAYVYRENLKSFENIPNLRGITPWILFDFLSVRRNNATYQKGWNMKGLVSADGNRKEAWYIMNEYYQKKY